MKVAKNPKIETYEALCYTGLFPQVQQYLLLTIWAHHHQAQKKDLTGVIASVSLDNLEAA
jgi:hypothetical protein